MPEGKTTRRADATDSSARGWSPSQAGRALPGFFRHHPGASIELLLGLYLSWKFLSIPDLRAMLVVLVGHAFSALHALWVLLLVDTQGTFQSIGASAIKLLIGILPLLASAWRWNRWERLRLLFWLPIVTTVLLPLAGAAPTVLLIGVSGLALWLIRFRWWRWTFVVPLLIVASPAANHLFGSLLWNGESLARRCAGNDGRRPINLRTEQMIPGYMGVSQVRPDEVLLAGQSPEMDRVPGFGSISVPRGPLTGGSWWLRRTGDDWRIDARSKVNGMFWKGCMIGDELWISRANIMVGVRRDPHTGLESVREIAIPANATDFGEVACLPEEGRLYIGEGLSGSAIWEVTAATGAVRKLAHPVGGLGALTRRGRPGELIAVNATDLVVYSLAREAVVARTPGAVQMFGGLDVCPLDWEAVLPDLTGRLRFFELGAEGEYHFKWGISLRAPRLVSYSPDCRYVVASSIDDETVWLIDRTARQVAATYRVGPALRGTTFLGPREFAVADACTMSVFTF